jgi:hypothetical protein
MRPFAIAGLLLAFAAPLAGAQDTPPQAAESRAEHRWGLGLGPGVVYTDGEGDAYFSINLRRRVGGGSSDKQEKETQAQKTGFRMGESREGLRAFVEAEYGWFKRTDTSGIEDKDQLVGLNLVGVIPARAVDVFLGIGFGVHFTSTTPVGGATTDETRVGGNAQFGVELNLSERVGAFGVGRVDFLEGERLGQQSKIWAGLRFRF